MNTSAIILMIVSMLILWGGVVVAIINLVRHDKRVEAERR